MRCVIEGCDRKASSRGLCHTCYITALRLVQAGETDWTALEKAGLCGPLMRSPNAFAAAYQKTLPRVVDLPGQTHLFEAVEQTNEVPNS